MHGHRHGLAVASVLVLTVGLAACDGTSVSTTSPSSVSPPSTPKVPSPSSVTLSGVVFDHTANGQVPRANVPLLVHAWYANVFMPVTSDANGRYRLSDVPVGPISIASADKSGYYTPCPAGWDVVKSDQVFDVHVVSASVLSTTGLPAFTPDGAIWVSGIVFERGLQGERPIAGATVTLGGNPNDSRVAATTLTDAAGRYLICPPVPSTGTDTYESVQVSRDGYQSASRSAFLGLDYNGVDIEMIRN